MCQKKDVRPADEGPDSGEAGDPGGCQPVTDAPEARDSQPTAPESQPTAELSQSTAPELSRLAAPKAMYSRSRKVRLIKGLPTKQLFQQIHWHARNGEVSNFALGFYLRDLQQRREFQEPGCASAVQYAVGALGRKAEEVCDLMRVARELESLPELQRAFAGGEISWSKIREIVRVAAPETEPEWLAFAREHNCREVERAVARARRGQKPPGPNDLGTPRVKFRVQYNLPAALNALWQTALEKVMAECGEGSTPADALRVMAEMAIATDPDRKVPGSPRCPEGRHPRKEPVYRVVFHVGPDGQAWHQAADGVEPVPLEAVLAVQGSADVIEVPDLESTVLPREAMDPGGAGTILFGQRGSVPPEARDRPTPAWMRDAVLAREGDCCAICGSRRDCKVHHLESVANGGKTRIQLLVTVCGVHHSLIHEGYIKLEVDERRKVLARSRDGRIIGREIPAREVLLGAPEDLAFPEVEIEAKNSTWRIPESQVVATPQSPMAEAKPSATSEPTAEPSQPSAPEIPEAPEETALPGTEEKNSTWSFSESQTVVAPHSPMEETTRSVAEPARTAGAPRAIAYAALAELPSVFTAPEWRALEGRLEWSAGRRAFVLREADDGVLLGPEPSTGDVPERLPNNRPRLPNNRPGTLSEVVGQRRVVENLSMAVKAAGLRGDALGHVLLMGQPGLGKTTLAGVLAREMGGRLHAAMGTLLSDPSQAIGLLTQLRRNDILFIDEIHRLPDPVTECLHSAMEDRVVHALLCERGRARSLQVTLEPFTLAGATMEPGSLREAFLARFAIRERLDPYPVMDLAQLVARAAGAGSSRPTASDLPQPTAPGPSQPTAPCGLAASELACFAVARRARGTPREALRLLERARDEAQAAGSPAIEASHVAAAARRLEIDPDGLRAEERRILETLLARGPVGLEALAAITGIDASTIRSVHEPYLLRKGYVIRTARGREATVEARIRMARGALPFGSAIPLKHLPPAVRMMILRSIRP